MSTETKTENTSTTIDNKALFGPLGKYAITGVIMVSIMITTVILLNRQPGTTAEDIAAIENAFSESNAVEINTNESTTSIDTTPTIESENNQAQDTVEVAEVEVTPVKVEAAAVQTTAVQTSEIPATETNKVAVAPETTNTVTSAEIIAADTGPDTEQAATIKPAKTETVVNNTTQTPLPQLVADNRDQQWQTRIQAHKLEQKQRMSEMFSRIRSLESEHLDQYKIRQDEHVEYLREQIVRQQELIEELILRNKESYEMREASMQRHQTSREKMLNRI